MAKVLKDRRSPRRRGRTGTNQCKIERTSACDRRRRGSPRPPSARPPPVCLASRARAGTERSAGSRSGSSRRRRSSGRRRRRRRRRRLSPVESPTGRRSRSCTAAAIVPRGRRGPAASPRRTPRAPPALPPRPRGRTWTRARRGRCPPWRIAARASRRRDASSSSSSSSRRSRDLGTARPRARRRDAAPPR
eukprot:30711-Pelagococcus_subviridis.AAC.5